MTQSKKTTTTAIKNQNSPSRTNYCTAPEPRFSLSLSLSLFIPYGVCWRSTSSTVQYFASISQRVHARMDACAMGSKIPFYGESSIFYLTPQGRMRCSTYSVRIREREIASFECTTDVRRNVSTVLCLYSTYSRSYP